MRHSIYMLFTTLCLIAGFWYTTASANTNGVPILVYHNIDPTKAGSMTLSTKKFAAQMQWLKDHGYTVIALKELVRYLQGDRQTLPSKSVVITDDDGRQSVYTHMLPIIRKYHAPVTLFIYPMVISHAHYAMTWGELKTLQHTGLFDIEDHTYWHPNFKQDKKKMSAAAFEKMVHVQLVTSKDVLEKKLGTKITLLAWPFGIHDAYLEQQAQKAGYLMAFSINARLAHKSENVMAMPRYMIIQDQSMQTFEAIVEGRSSKLNPLR